MTDANGIRFRERKIYAFPIDGFATLETSFASTARSPLLPTEIKMAPMKILARVLTDEVDGGYRITMETDDGEILRVFATENQISNLADELDEMLDEDDSELTDEEEHVGEEQPS